MKLERDEIASLIEKGGEDLLVEADVARRQYCGDAVHLRGIIEFSNVCDRNCLYCGLRRDNTNIPRYTMTADEIFDVTSVAVRAGVHTIVLQSGESDAAQADRLAETVAAVKQRFDVAVTLCVGQKAPGFYQAWRQAGADRYLLKHETSTAELYNKFHPGLWLNTRLNALLSLQALGYQIGNGCIIGLPGQTWDSLLQDIQLAHELDVDMASFGPFVPHPHTPLANSPAGDITLSLRVVAAARLVLGTVHIPATTAFDAIAPDGRERALRCGANVIMANITPARYRHLYDIYPSNKAADSIENVKAIIDRTGRPLASDYGHTLKHPMPSETCIKPQKV